MIDKSKNFISLVSANDLEVFNQTPGNGKIWDIYGVCASMPDVPEIKCEIKWDTEIVFVCHGNWQREALMIQITGDGSKVLSMRMINDSNSSETMRLHMHAMEQ